MSSGTPEEADPLKKGTYNGPRAKAICKLATGILSSLAIMPYLRCIAMIKVSKNCTAMAVLPMVEVGVSCYCAFYGRGKIDLVILEGYKNQPEQLQGNSGEPHAPIWSGTVQEQLYISTWQCPCPSSAIHLGFFFRGRVLSVCFGLQFPLT